MKRRIHFSLLLLLPAVALLLNTAAADNLDAAAVRRFQTQTTAAMQGKADDQFRLGQMYEKGEGTRTDLAMAYLWYNRAALQGHASAKEKTAALDKSKEGSAEEQTRVDAVMRALQQQSDRDKGKAAEAAKARANPPPAPAKAPEPVTPAKPPAPANAGKDKAPDGEFSSNPCKGPQAKFLSTCN